MKTNLHSYALKSSGKSSLKSGGYYESIGNGMFRMHLMVECLHTFCCIVYIGPTKLLGIYWALKLLIFVLI